MAQLEFQFKELVVAGLFLSQTCQLEDFKPHITIRCCSFSWRTPILVELELRNCVLVLVISTHAFLQPQLSAQSHLQLLYRKCKFFCLFLAGCPSCLPAGVPQLVLSLDRPRPRFHLNLVLPAGVPQLLMVLPSAVLQYFHGASPTQNLIVS